MKTWFKGGRLLKQSGGVCRMRKELKKGVWVAGAEQQLFLVGLEVVNRT